ncbi:cation diffusion facilitator family transporter [Pedobacter sp. AK017]|uniref:Cation diffusion facilitator family transporter n=1 Tax=Pedobacter heparinus (strain ATCC 13125 / DSM 2366 / CIP 104194 / JCM 7457 / NBRC 12017 / NCIMB 9290 / NRRL B-14731 / HIM 762-3) TaxID=485917 RepID=C6Y060_PEDHD|nr:cation diffusion facilitator family transporter [Pedobacter heparinus DSM 2366]MBB5437377.1 cation diffusion facilitator family transporter [Pedobacter sp. AK017]
MDAKLSNLQPQKKAILIALCISIVLMLAKFVAYFITHSNAILTDAAESIVNVLASSFAFYSIYLATLPKDENHPYGHGKVEFFSAFIEGTLIAIAGIIIVFKSGYDLIYPKPITQLFEGASIIGATGLVNLFIGYYLINTGKKHKSITLEADGKHLLTDAITSAGLVIGIVLIKLTAIYWMDSVISMLLGLYIIYNGYKLTRRSVGGLMDESNIDLVETIINILQKNRKEPWIDVHNLRAQQYGADLHIDCHITLPYYFDLNQVHQEISEIDKMINGNADRKTELFIHADPCLPACCNYCKMKECPVRQEPFRGEIKWTVENATKNQKHFDQ